MSRRLLAAYLALVILPIAALAWLSARLVRAEVEEARARVAELALASLRTTAATVSDLLEERRREIVAALESSSGDGSELRAMARRLPAVRQTFRLLPTGQLAYPSPGGDLDREEEAFLRRTSSFWTSGALNALAAAEETASAPSFSPRVRDRLATDRMAAPSAGGWHAWHQDDGLHVMYWRRAPDLGLEGAELDRIRLLADVVARLPDASTAPGGRFRLLDAEGRVLHQWGPLDPDGREPVARLSLRPPLSAWSVEYYDAGDPHPGRAALASAAAWMVTLFVLLGVLATHVYRTSDRELREARTRVSFVSQVSHELKTPLTNVRLYAELLESEVSEEPTAARYARIIATESQRLSRLIGNVLTFGRQERRELRVTRRPGVLDDVVRRVLEAFRPALDTRNVTLEADLGAGAPCGFDPDAVEQILNNLLSNVEKYASAGGLALVCTRLAGTVATLTVGDRGPGIPSGHRERVFEPFARVSDALTEGVSGAGLGLTIARELARLHGGDVRLVGEGPGATFEVTLEVSPAGTEGAA